MAGFPLRLEQGLRELPGVFADFATDLQVRGLQERTICAYLFDLRQLLAYMLAYGLTAAPHMTAITCDELTALEHDAVNAFLARYQPKVAGKAQRGMLRKLSSLNAFYKYLLRAGRSTVNPAGRVDARPAYRKVKPNPKSLSHEDLLLYLETIKSGNRLPEGQQKYHTPFAAARDYAIALVFLTSGLRLSELCGLNVGDVDLERGRLRAIRKGGVEDYPPLHPLAAAAVQAYLPLRPPAAGEYRRRADEPLFVAAPPRATRLNPRTVWHNIKKYALAIDPLRYRFVSPHKLRHTFGQLLYDQTRDLYAVAAALHHKQVDTARWYAAVTTERRSQVVRDLRLGGEPGEQS